MTAESGMEIHTVIGLSITLGYMLAVIGLCIVGLRACHRQNRGAREICRKLEEREKPLAEQRQ